MDRSNESTENWPTLPYDEWSATRATLHMWLQIVGKIRVALVPWTNHQWHVTLHVTSRGLSSRPIPGPMGTFQIDFDFLDHVLLITASDGRIARVVLEPRSVADFYNALMTELRAMGVEVKIHTSPNEVEDPVPFHENERDGSYEAEYVERYFRILSNSARIFDDFRGAFIGKCSPVHFFWGGMDLAVTRFSGRRAPEHPGGVTNLPDWVTREAYSHEVSSAGFWPGSDANPYPLYYSYAYPSPAGYSDAVARPEAASWNPELGEFVLSYDEARRGRQPEDAVMEFLASTYDAAATLGRWDRSVLEWARGQRPPTGGF